MDSVDNMTSTVSFEEMSDNYNRPYERRKDYICLGITVGNASVHNPVSLFCERSDWILLREPRKSACSLLVAGSGFLPW